MPAFEKKLLTWLHKHIDIILLIAVSLLGLLMRFMLGSLHAMMSARLSSSVHASVPSYDMPVYVTMIFDLLMAAAVMAMVALCAGSNAKQKGKWAYVLMLLSFGNIFSSAGLGRIDGLWVALCVLGIICVFKEKYLWAFVSLSAACLISSWALLCMPFFLFLYLYKEKFSLISFLVPVAAALLRYFSGIDRDGWLPEGISYRNLYAAYPSFWGFIKGDSPAEFAHYMPLALVITAAAVAALMILTCRRRYKYDNKGLLWIAFLGSALSAYFIPGAGAGAAALTTVLAWGLVFTDSLLIIPALIMEALRIWPVAAQLYGTEWMPFSVQGQCWINAALMLFYLIFFYKKVLDDKEQV
ncbi:MAG: hypothetical protein IJM34_02875 [Lachnospiraceae bacterium]|nr:hypothetical protein [Lachnospiraceae bacterium]